MFKHALICLQGESVTVTVCIGLLLEDFKGWFKVDSIVDSKGLELHSIP